MDGYSLVPAGGGHSAETYFADAGGEQTVVRIYARRGAARGPIAADIDAAVLRLVRGLLPVAEVLEVRPGDPGTGAPMLLVTSRLPGERLDLVLPRLTGARLRTAGHAVGTVLARLAQVPLLRPGLFVDGDLRVEPFSRDLGDLVETARSETALAAWSRDDADALVAVAEQAQVLLDGLDRTCLVHSDFNPKNLLVDPQTLTVTGLVDWEFAHAGWPVTDLGNLLRFDRQPAFVDAVLETWRAQVPDARDDVVELARAADLVALVDLAGRRGSSPVADRAHDQLRAIARTGDRHAWVGRSD